MSNVVTPTARFWRQVIIDLTVMSIVGLVLGLIGPFGSYADPLALRLIYWLGLSYAGYACYRPVSYFVLKAGQKLDLAEWGLWVMACLIATIPMSVIVWLIGFLSRPLRAPSLQQALGTYASVLLIGSGITVVFFLLERRGNAAAPASIAGVPASGQAEAQTHRAAAGTPREGADRAQFLDRLPAEIGTDLIALEMEDHSVRARTALGSELVLMRMRDAVAEMGGLNGMQVHRSWWVAGNAVADVKRDGRNVRLILDNGIEAPVSRVNVQLLKDAGWI